MKVFILGVSHCGKSPVAAAIAQATNSQLISTSEYARASLIDVTARSGDHHEHMASYIGTLTDHTIDILQRSPNAGVEFLMRKYDLSKPTVLDGERNPFDFASLFDPRTDLVVSLQTDNNKITETVFDSGIQVIWAYLDWLKGNRLLNACQDRRYSFNCLYERDKQEMIWSDLESNIAGIVDQAVSDAQAVAQWSLDECRSDSD